MADNIKYRFIQNVGDYFPAGYFNEDFIDRVQKVAGLTSEQMEEYAPRYRRLKAEYEKYKNFLLNNNPRVKDAIKHTHDFHTLLLETLGYDAREPYSRFVELDDAGKVVIPVRHILHRHGQISMLIMEMQNLVKTGEEECPGLFEQRYDAEDGREEIVAHQRYRAAQWGEVFTVPEDAKISPAIINKAVDSLFLLPQEQRPKFILMLAGNELMLLDGEKWSRGSWLQFSLDELFSQASIGAFRKYYALFHLLVSKQTLADNSETVLMDTLIEDSYKNAFEVTKDLKEGVVLAVETLANEALHYMRNVANRPFGKLNKETGLYDETNDDFESEIKDDCLTIIYRLLFIFYAESRPELEILPMGDAVYQHGYSLEMLRDLEQARLNSQESRDGYFFDDSMRMLFNLLHSGYKDVYKENGDKSFSVRKVESPLFDNSKLNHFADVRIRNSEWQKIICALSLSAQKKRYGRGRISYANLGVNQLGSVYESLLAYRGFYAEEDYIEVYKPGKLSEGTFLVPYSRIQDFKESEILYEKDSERPVIHPKGRFIYRMNGRDRQKSASYYTPEVLTRSTVKYTLKAIIDEVADGKRKASELLKLKILEPAMGAAAFQNEVINQIAEAYLTYKQKETGKRISPDRFLDERQKVKAYIATHNVYGVDLNPTAVELGKLSLWLNVIHKDMGTPFFAGRVALGNAVVGAWFKTFNRSEVVETIDRSGKKPKRIPTPWWDFAPRKIRFSKSRAKRSKDDVYHFLLPDPGMLAASGIKEMKSKFPEEIKTMKERMKNWKGALSASDFVILQRLSAKIDFLLCEHYKQQSSIDEITSDSTHIWDGIQHAPKEGIFGDRIDFDASESYKGKQQAYETRFSPISPYYRLKLVMDYWCSLWFWPLEAADAVPTREQFWEEVERILGVDNKHIDDKRIGETGVFPQTLFAEEDFAPYESAMQAEEEEIELETRAQLLARYSCGERTPVMMNEVRFALIRNLSERYRYFHPMLEFIEVFWKRGGFDIIAGNPPWRKLRYDIGNIVSDTYPEFSIRDYKSEAVMKALSKMELPVELQETIDLERLENEGTTAFQNSILYAPLKGQQTDLYRSILVNSFDLVSEKGYIGMVHPNEVFLDAKGVPFFIKAYPALRYRFQFHNMLKLFAEVHPNKIYDIVIYGTPRKYIQFDSISNLYRPETIEACYAHTGSEPCGGVCIITPEGEKKLNTKGHRERIIRYDEKQLSLLGNALTGNNAWYRCCLYAIHNTSILKVVLGFDRLRHLKDYNPIFSVAFDATNDIKLTNLIRRRTSKKHYEDYEVIFNSTMVNLLSPFSKVPQEICEKDNQYDTIDYSNITDD